MPVVGKVTRTPTLHAQQAIFYCPASHPVIGYCAEHLGKQANYTNPHCFVPLIFAV
ncbi:hypothetical protein DJ61_4237 [Yersinia enterocolitica]|nr:hypothetical protein DJ61_4237 [Yersinia enterocolitica]